MTYDRQQQTFGRGWRHFSVVILAKLMFNDALFYNFCYKSKPQSHTLSMSRFASPSFPLYFFHLVSRIYYILGYLPSLPFNLILS